jgi:nicotinamide-nucleotide amidase
MDADLVALSEAVGSACHQRRPGTDSRFLVATAESCTGGWVAQVITHTAGSSAWFERGFITYSNAAKMEMLGVRAATLTEHGAVSEATACEMAAGALAKSTASISLAVTGIAGPTGGSKTKPVGTICFAWCRVGEAAQTETQHFMGDREAIRRQAVVHALQGLLKRIE